MAKQRTERPPKTKASRLNSTEQDQLDFIRDMLTRMNKRAASDSDAIRYAITATFENES